MVHHHRFRDFYVKQGFFGTVLGICGVAFVRALGLSVKRHHSLLGVLNVKLVYLPSCIRPNSNLHLINVFSVVIVVKNVLWLSQAVFSFFVIHRSKIPSVLTTKVVTHLSSLLFREHDGVNFVLRRVYSAITAKLVPTE